MASSEGPSHGGVSLTAKVALLGDSSARHAVAPAVQWCRMVWTAARRPELSLVSHAELIRLWDLSNPLECQSWAKSRGPIARAVLCLSRAGWRAEGPTSWFDHNGLAIDLASTPPSLLADQLELGLQREREFAFARNLGCPQGSRATLDLVRNRVSSTARKYTRYQK